MKYYKTTLGSNLIWEGSRFILPEQKAAYLTYQEEQNKVPKPELDEQALQEMGSIIMDSLYHELEVNVKYWEDGYFKHVKGIVDKVDMELKQIKLRFDEDYIYLKIDCLKHVERS